MTSKYVLGIGAALLLVVAGCCCDRGVRATGCEAEDGVDGEEVAIPLDRLPAGVRAAAEAAVPGLVIEEASREVENGVVLYDVEGTAGGKEFEIEVSADGKVLEVEEDGPDREGDDDEDADERDDDEG